MSCPHCQSTSTVRRRARTALGYRIYYCRCCQRRFNQRTDTEVAPENWTVGISGFSAPTGHDVARRQGAER